MTPRELALKVAWQFVGTHYTWGGDDPAGGFDCSGLVIECMKSVGVLPRGKGDWSADAMMKMWETRKVNGPVPGTLVFYLDGDRAVHVEICLDDRFTIGANGGGSHVKTVADAILFNAFIQVRPMDVKRPHVFIDPYVEQW